MRLKKPIAAHELYAALSALEIAPVAALRDPVYAMRMAANALAMAAREAETGEADLVRELRLLAELYGEDVVQSAGATLHERIAKMTKKFARDIRDGIFDGACSQGVQALLMDQVRARLRISNPNYLKSAGLD